MTISPGDQGILTNNILNKAIKPSAGDSSIYFNGILSKAIQPATGDKITAYPNGKGGWIVFKAGLKGNLYIFDADNSRVKIHDADTNVYASEFSSTVATGIHADGDYLYVRYSDRIRKYLISDLSYVSETPIAIQYYSAGICTTETHLFTTDTLNHKIIKFLKSDLSYVSNIGSYGTGNDEFEYPWGITTDGTYLYICDSWNARIVKRLCSDLSYIDQVSIPSESPYGICNDGSSLYFTGHLLHKLYKYTTDLAPISNVGSNGTWDEQFNGPWGICHDGTTLYIVDFGNDRIIKRAMSDLSYKSKFGTTGSGNDNFDHPETIAISLK